MINRSRSAFVLLLLASIGAQLLIGGGQQALAQGASGVPAMPGGYGAMIGRPRLLEENRIPNVFEPPAGGWRNFPGVYEERIPGVAEPPTKPGGGSTRPSGGDKEARTCIKECLDIDPVMCELYPNICYK